MVDVIRLGPDSVGAFHRLHRSCEDGGWCACTAWWVPWAGFGERSAEENAALRASLFDRGEYDGYLAMELDEAVGWCQVGPRDRLHKLRDQYDLEPAIGAWAVTCFKVRPDRRGRRIAHQLLLGVLEDLPKRGATRVEAFPKRLKTRDPMDHWTGPESIYLACGFEVVRAHKRHPVLALDLR